MEEQKKTTEEAEVTPQVKLMDKEPVVAAVEQTPAPVAQGAPKKRANTFTIVAIVLVLIALVAVWFRLEKENRVDTTFFSSLIEKQEANAVVATVNGEELYGKDLELSMEQLRQAAIAQGLDPETEPIATEIRTQAIEMMVNTELLQQAAAEEGVEVTEEDVTARMEQIEADAGGAEVLAERMEEFDIDRETFAADVRTELVITELLEGVFAEADLEVTDEEVDAVYVQGGGGTEGVPELEVVRPQIEAQIVRAKEQAAVDAYLAELRTTADIEIES